MINEDNRDNKRDSARERREPTPAADSTHNDARCQGDAGNRGQGCDNPQKGGHGDQYHEASRERSDKFKVAAAVFAAALSLVSAISAWRSANGSNSSANTAKQALANAVRPTVIVTFPDHIAIQDLITGKYQITFKNSGPGAAEFEASTIQHRFLIKLDGTDIVPEAPEHVIRENYPREMAAGEGLTLSVTEKNNDEANRLLTANKFKPEGIAVYAMFIYRDVESNLYSQEFCAVYNIGPDYADQQRTCQNLNSAPIRLPPSPA